MAPTTTEGAPMTELPPATLAAYLPPPSEPDPEAPDAARRVELARCVVVLFAGLAAWAALAVSHPAGPAWVLTWLVAPALAFALLVAAGVALAARHSGSLPPGRVQLAGYLGLALLYLSAWGWLGSAVPALSWPVAVLVGVPLGLVLAGLTVRALGTLLLSLLATVAAPLKERRRRARWARWNAERARRSSEALNGA
jgi:hypothetical protein